MSNTWTPINMPTEQIEAVKRIIEERPELGYRSPGDFYRNAVREKLQELYSNLPQNY